MLMLCELSFVWLESSKLEGTVHVCFVPYLFPVSFSAVTNKLHDTFPVTLQG